MKYLPGSKGTGEVFLWAVDRAAYQTGGAIGLYLTRRRGAMGIRISLPASLRRKAQKYGAPVWGNTEAGRKI